MHVTNHHFLRVVFWPFVDFVGGVDPIVSELRVDNLPTGFMVDWSSNGSGCRLENDDGFIDTLKPR